MTKEQCQKKLNELNTRLNLLYSHGEPTDMNEIRALNTQLNALLVVIDSPCAVGPT